jgi:hypothetical protein
MVSSMKRPFILPTDPPPPALAMSLPPVRYVNSLPSPNRRRNEHVVRFFTG